MNADDILRLAVECQLLTTENRDGIYADALTRFANRVHAEALAEKQPLISAEASLRFRLDCTKEQLEAAELEISELRQKLRKAEQPAEPVAEIQVSPNAAGGVTALVWGVSLPVGTYKLYTTPQPAIPPGYKLVPVEPTPEMKDVKTWDYGAFRPASEIWADMLAAAPEAPQPKLAEQEPLTDDEDLLERLYWEFDSQRKKLGEERKVFKGKMRFYAAAHGITKERNDG